MWEMFFILSVCRCLFPPLPSSPSLLLPSFAVFPFVMNMSRHFVDCITIELRLVIFIGTSLD